MRKANDTKQSIAERLRDQDVQLQQCRTRAKDLEKRLMDMKDAARTGDPADILKRLEEGTPSIQQARLLLCFCSEFSQTSRRYATKAQRLCLLRSKPRRSVFTACVFLGIFLFSLVLLFCFRCASLLTWLLATLHSKNSSEACTCMRARAISQHPVLHLRAQFQCNLHQFLSV